MIRKNLAIKYNAIPIEIKKEDIVVEINKDNIYALQDLKLATRKNIIFKIEDEYKTKEAIEMYYSDCDINNDDYYKEILNEMLIKALEFNSSDIHIEPFDNTLKIRMRIDGYLKEIYNYPIGIHMKLTTIIKLLAGLDIAEKRLPQDGRIDKIINKNTLDLRISTISTVHGEKIVIRILNRNKFLKNKKEIGFSDIAINKIGNIVNHMSGILLITGPTGSGKTTTLYSILNDFRLMDKNIVTIEDPVEYKIEGINQIQLNTKIGLTFSKGLRAILRQDPDVIMVGEIRDPETAQIAMRAAATGHLVISTMHTNNAIESINRLLDMGIPRYLIASSLKGVISQRLLRRVCKHCSLEEAIDKSISKYLKLNEKLKVKIARGCSECNNKGYKGSVVLYKIVEIDKDIRKAIINQENIEDIYNTAKLNDMITFLDSCSYLINEKITTLNESIGSGLELNRGELNVFI